MNVFVHGKLGHFLMDETDGDGNDLGGGADDASDDDGDDADSDDAGDDSGDDDEQNDDDGDVIVTIGNEKPPVEGADEQAAPKWVRELRKASREKDKKIRELEDQVRKSVPEQKAPELGKKPSMDDPDIDWDAEKFEEQLTAWHDRKRQADQAHDQARKEEQAQQDAWQERLASYATAKTGLKVKDFEDAEDVTRNSLNVTQQGIIIQGAENPALVVYALGKNPKKAAELAGITDHVKFAFAIAKLETQLKVQNRKSAPPPEGKVSGTARVSGSVDSNLERLRAEAEKSGDMTKVNAYKRQQREKAKG
jgi:hypothetical protein